MNSVTFSNSLNNFLSGKISRREFIRSSLALASIASLGQLLGCVYQDAQVLPRLSPQQDEQMSAVFDVLFPSEQESPGARELDTLAYLHFVMLDPTYDSSDKELIQSGLERLQEESDKRFGKPFLTLRAEQRHLLFEHIQTLSWGKRWMTRLLNVALEGMLADPLYGSNRDGAGWRWLEFQPGVPRPTAIPTEMRPKA